MLSTCELNLHTNLVRQAPSLPPGGENWGTDRFRNTQILNSWHVTAEPLASSWAHAHQHPDSGAQAWAASEPPGKLWVSGSVSLGWSSRICMCDKFPGDAAASGTHGENHQAVIYRWLDGIDRVPPTPSSPQHSKITLSHTCWKQTLKTSAC